MGDLFFVIRMMVFTVVAVVLMQIKIGEATIETHAYNWMSGSAAVAALRDVSRGAVKAMSQAYKSAVAAIDTKLNSNFNREQMAGARSFGLDLRRSDAFVQEQAQRRAANQDNKRAAEPATGGTTPEADDEVGHISK